MNELINNKKKSEILAEYISNLQYGDVIRHNNIEAIIQETYGSPKYNSEIQRAKVILLKNYHKKIENIHGEGYRVVQPDDFVTQSLKHYRRGFNQLQKGYETLENAPVQDMSQEGKDVHKRMMDRSLILMASMQGTKVELKTLSRRNPFAPELIANK